MFTSMLRVFPNMFSMCNGYFFSGCVYGYRKNERAGASAHRLTTRGCLFGTVFNCWTSIHNVKFESAREHFARRREVHRPIKRPVDNGTVFIYSPFFDTWRKVDVRTNTDAGTHRRKVSRLPCRHTQLGEETGSVTRRINTFFAHHINNSRVFLQPHRQWNETRGKK